MIIEVVVVLLDVLEVLERDVDVMLVELVVDAEVVEVEVDVDVVDELVLVDVDVVVGGNVTVTFMGVTTRGKS